MSFGCTEPFMYCTNWMAWPSGSVTTKLRLPLASVSTLAGTATPLAGEVVAEAARVGGLEADADQAILVALQRRRELDELGVVHLEGDEIALDRGILGREGFGEADDSAVELPRLVEVVDLGGEVGDAGDLRTLGCRRRAPDGHGQQKAQRQGELAVGSGHSCGLRLCDLAPLRRAPPDRNNCHAVGRVPDRVPDPRRGHGPGATIRAMLKNLRRGALVVALGLLLRPDAAFAQAQPAVAAPPSRTRAHVDTLASPKLEGRLTGSPARTRRPPTSKRS